MIRLILMNLLKQKNNYSIRDISLSNYTVEILKDYKLTYWEKNDENRLYSNIISGNGVIQTLRRLPG